MTVYSTAVDDVIVHESGWYRIGDIEVPCVPPIDAQTLLFARLDTRRSMLAAENYGATLASRVTVRKVIELALQLGTLIDPVILPTADMRRANPKASWESQEHYERRIRLDMASFEWAKIHDLECWRRLESLPVPWDRKTITGNVGKWFYRGAPPGRCWLMGWYDRKTGKYIQPGTDSGPGPHAGGSIVNGVEIPGQMDYASLPLWERPAR